MRDQHDGDPVFLVEAFEDVQDLHAGGRIEVAGRLVGQQQRWSIDQGAGNGDPLLLAAGQLVGMVIFATAEPDGGQRLLGPSALLSLRQVAVDERELDVLDRARTRQEIEVLEDEPDFSVADRGALIRRKAGDVDAAQPIRTAGRPVETAEDVHQGRLARARGPHDRDELTRADLEGHAAERMHFRLTHRVDLRELPDGDQRLDHQCRIPAKLGGGSARSDVPERRATATGSPACRSPETSSA